MTNGEKYKTAIERSRAFQKFCNVCELCPITKSTDCRFVWLDREVDELLPCPFCGNDVDISVSGVVKCPTCGYSGGICEKREDAITSHNRVALAVIDAKHKANNAHL